MLSTDTLKLFSLDQLHKPKKQLKPDDLQAIYVLICKAAKRVYVGCAFKPDVDKC